MYHAGISIAGVAADAFAVQPVGLIEFDGNRQIKGLMPSMDKVVMQFLDTRFMTKMRKRVLSAAEWFDRLRTIG